MTKAIIVSPEEVHAYFTEARPDWDTQHPILSISQMWDELESEELDPESEVVIFNELYLNDEDEEMELAIATFAPETIVMVILYDPANEQMVAERIRRKQQALGMAQAPFYFLDTQRPELMDDIEQIIEDHRSGAQSEFSAAQITAALAGERATPVTPMPQVSYQDERDEDGDGRPDIFVAAERDPEEKLGLVVASTSSKGGAGKTTVGLCFASMMAHSSRLAAERGMVSENGTPARALKVCIVDMDTFDGQIGFNLGKQSPTALNIFIKPDKSVDSVMEELIYHERLGIYALLAPKRARTAGHLTPEFYDDVIYKLRTQFDVVILDTSVHYLVDPLLSQLILPVADAVMFVSNLSLGAVYGMIRWMDEVTADVEDGGAGIPKEKIGIVVNQSMPNVGIDQELLKHAASGAKLLVAIPMDSGAVLAASNNNRLSDIVLEHPYISPQYFRLAQKVWGAWRDEPLADPLADQEVATRSKRGATSSPNAPAASSKTVATPVGAGGKPVKKGFFRR